MKDKQGRSRRKLMLTGALALVLAVVMSCGSALASYSLLKSGSTGEKVRTMQKSLIALGYYTGVANGRYDRETERAVRTFQTANGLEVDGKAGNKTLTVLYQLSGKPAELPSESTGVTLSGNLFNKNYSIMRYGSHGARVKTLQTALATLGYNPGKIDGIYGAATLRAVNAFQTKNSLKTDGKAGPQTLAAVETAVGGGKITVPAAPIPTVASGMPRRNLKRYNEGNDVLSVQKRLAYYGFYDGKQDGIFGKGTVAAVKNFQAAYGLKEDGVCGNEVYKILYSETKVDPPENLPEKKPASEKTPTRSLHRGCTGADVTSLQQKLTAAGFYKGKADGKYGSGTVAAVKAFQKANKLTVDGVAGKATYAVLYAAPKAPATPTDL